jgi:hypothetical protein
MDDTEAKVALMLFFDAMEEYEDTGKVTYLAKVTFKYPMFEKFFLEVLAELEDPKNYPYVITKQVDKLRPRKVVGRPKESSEAKDHKLTYMRIAIDYARMSLKTASNEQPTKSAIIKCAIDKMKLLDEEVQLANASQSKLYVLFDEDLAHIPQDTEFKESVEKKFTDFEEGSSKKS